MPDDSNQLYPDWRPEYQAAMLEFDRMRLPGRILSARKAIAERMNVLAQDHFGTPEERQAITDALNALSMLERELQKHGS